SVRCAHCVRVVCSSHASRPHRDLHSFPTRRSSDLQDVPLLPGVFFFPATRSVYDAVLTWIFRVLILLSPLSGFQPPSSFEFRDRSEEHTSELQSRFDLVCRLLLEKKKN